MKVAELVRKANMIIWDEPPMMHHRASKAIDRTLCDLMQLDDAHATKKIFDGKTVVLGGDFQQIQPVVPKGRRDDIINASLPRLYFWQDVIILCFHINTRIMATSSKEQQEFAKWVLNVGDGSLLAIVEEEGVDLDWIKISSHMRLPTNNCSLRRLIRTINPDHQCHSGDAMYLMQHFGPQKY
jgi:hypothetical protein